jgi:predicted SnoaL-like aldol condensation-catalyzing enzyme
MRKFACLLALAIGCVPVLAQVPPTPHPNPQSLLQSDNENLAHNKKLVYDFWREVLEAGPLELAEKYLTEGYIQHNPNVPTGRQGFIDFFSKFNRKPEPIAPKIKAPLIAIIAEGDLVMLCFVAELPRGEQDPAKKYTTTFFDMFRIEDGKLAEHWDGAQKR